MTSRRAAVAAANKAEASEHEAREKEEEEILERLNLEFWSCYGNIFDLRLSSTRRPTEDNFIQVAWIDGPSVEQVKKIIRDNDEGVLFSRMYSDDFLSATVKVWCEFLGEPVPYYNRRRRRFSKKIKAAHVVMDNQKFYSPLSRVAAEIEPQIEVHNQKLALLIQQTDGTKRSYTKLLIDDYLSTRGQRTSGPIFSDFFYLGIDYTRFPKVFDVFINMDIHSVSPINWIIRHKLLDDRVIVDQDLCSFVFENDDLESHGELFSKGDKILLIRPGLGFIFEYYPQIKKVNVSCYENDPQYREAISMVAPQVFVYSKNKPLSSIQRRFDLIILFPGVIYTDESIKEKETLLSLLEPEGKMVVIAHSRTSNNFSTEMQNNRTFRALSSRVAKFGVYADEKTVYLHMHSKGKKGDKKEES